MYIMISKRKVDYTVCTPSDSIILVACMCLRGSIIQSVPKYVSYVDQELISPQGTYLSSGVVHSRSMLYLTDRPHIRVSGSDYQPVWRGLHVFTFPDVYRCFYGKQEDGVLPGLLCIRWFRSPLSDTYKILMPPPQVLIPPTLICIFCKI